MERYAGPDHQPAPLPEALAEADALNARLHELRNTRLDRRGDLVRIEIALTQEALLLFAWLRLKDETSRDGRFQPVGHDLPDQVLQRAAGDYVTLALYNEFEERWMDLLRQTLPCLYPPDEKTPDMDDGIPF